MGSQHHEVSGGVNAVVAAACDHVLLPRSCFDDTKGILAVQELTGWSANTTTASTTGNLCCHTGGISILSRVARTKQAQLLLLSTNFTCPSTLFPATCRC